MGVRVGLAASFGRVALAEVLADADGVALAAVCCPPPWPPPWPPL